MTSQLVELKNNAKLNRWYKEIKSQKQSGLTVDEWCEQNDMNRHTYYYRYKVVMSALEERLAKEHKKAVRFVALLAPSTESRKETNVIRLRLGDRHRCRKLHPLCTCS